MAVACGHVWLAFFTKHLSDQYTVLHAPSANKKLFCHRHKLQNATVDIPQQSGFRPSASTIKGGNRVLETMSEPVDISMIDAVADEIAELVSNHTFNFRMEDTFNTTVVSFKPVAGTISSSN